MSIGFELFICGVILWMLWAPEEVGKKFAIFRNAYAEWVRRP